MNASPGKSEQKAPVQEPRVSAENQQAPAREMGASKAILALQSSSGNKAVTGLLGGGRPIDERTRREMEERFGQDFGDVRIHSDEAGKRTALAAGARALTSGRDVAFAPGFFEPNSTKGRTLLAHELAHVVQQRGGGTSSSDHAEADARHAASKAAAGESATVQAGAPGGAQADPLTDEELRAAQKAAAQPLAPGVGGASPPATQASDASATPARPKRPGRAGTPQTAQQNYEIGTELEKAGYEIKGGGGGPKFGRPKETYFPGPGGKQRGSVSPDVHAKAPNDTVFVQTVTTTRGGRSSIPDRREMGNLGRLIKAGRKVDPNAGYVTVPKGAPSGAPAGGATPTPSPDAPTPASGADVPATDAVKKGEGAGGEGAGEVSKAAASDVPAGTGVQAEVPAPELGGAPKPAGGEVTAPGETPGAAAVLEGKPSGIGPVAAEAGAAAEFSLSGAILGMVVEQAIFAALALAVQWAAAKLFEAELQSEIDNILKPAMAAKFQQLQPKFKQLAGTRKLMARVTYDFTYQRDSPDDPVGSFMQGGPPFYMPGSMRLVNVHPGNEELDFASASSETRTPILGPRESVIARSSYSVLLDDPQRRAREKQNREIVERHRVKESAPAAAKKPSAPAPAAASAPNLLSPPGAVQEQPALAPFGWAPGPSPFQEIDQNVARGRDRCLQLISYGQKILAGNGGDVQKFLKAESDWRDMVTYAYNHYKDEGPDYGRAKCDELLNSDEFGGRLKQMRQTFGG